jgi:RNA polymerase sigma factor (sigma-70 family)
VDADNRATQATATPPAQVPKLPPAAALRFYREHYRTLMRAAMYAGATEEQADEATSLALADIVRRFDDIAEPLAYGRSAVINNFIKAKTTGLDRLRVRQVQRSAGTPVGMEDPGLIVWEDAQWVRQMLDELPPQQRTVMAFVVDGFTPTQISVMLGRSANAVRQSLLEARRRLQKVLDEQATKQEPAAEQGASFMREETR